MTAAERMEHVGKLRPQLVRYARTRLLNPAHAEDAVQETLLAAIESIDRFSGGSSLFSWLTGILKHKIVDCVRRSARDQWHEMDNDGTPMNADGLDPGQSGHASGGWGDPENALLRRRRLEALERCVRELPKRTAETFFLRAVMGLNAVETCHALEVSEANCAVMLHRARARIRKTLPLEWITQ
jgi:RNA polymerase sigma-70 factor (ECF subfamily)